LNFWRLGTTVDFDEAIFVTYGGCSGVLDHFGGVDINREHSVKLVDKVTVVDETSVTNTVPVDKLIGLLFGQIDAKGANAGAELSQSK
jgi:hypothetical protein